MKPKMKQDNLSVDIRPINSSADAVAMRELYHMSLRHNTQGFVQDLSFHGDIVERAKQYQAHRGEMLGVYIDGKMAGFGGLVKISETNVELGKLHLHPDYQGLGIGRRIAENLIMRAKELGYTIVELHVTVTQNAAIGLYKKLGFTETGRRICTVLGVDFDTIFMELRI